MMMDVGKFSRGIFAFLGALFVTPTRLPLHVYVRFVGAFSVVVVVVDEDTSVIV